MQLNREQQQAVLAPLGATLVLAGAGSGKTRVLIERINHLYTEHLAPISSFLAVTFTNKAALEMRHRLNKLWPATGMWIGTFHAIAHRMLRDNHQAAELGPNFTILDSDEQLAVIKSIIKQLNIDDSRFEPKQLQNVISRNKEEGNRLYKPLYHNNYEEVVMKIVNEYNNYCNKENVLDFSDLLLRAYEMLNKHPSILLHYQHRLHHILVDEFQDTNTIQYLWLKLLATNAKSVMAVGDDDQSIYGWRGAKIENIKRYINDFPHVQTIRLEQNYRSTTTILAAANAVIANNKDRLGKNLWSSKQKGDNIKLYSAFNEEDEALFIVRRIKELQGQFQAKDMAILYRSNAQSRILEEALMRASIPYSIYGGVKFFERSEIKDVLAYIKLAVNLHNNIAFERVYNMPLRGIGERNWQRIKEFATNNYCSFYSASKLIVATDIITSKIKQALVQFLDIIEQLRQIAVEDNLPLLIEKSINLTGLMNFYYQQKGDLARNKIENLEELINASYSFVQESGSEHSIDNFLSYVTLDSTDTPGKTQQGVQLMTIHSAKGLEFPVVFLCGLEEGLFPHRFCSDNIKLIEEERRLCYVGITRAMQMLYLTHAESRRMHGNIEYRRLSRFVEEIPKHLLQANVSFKEEHSYQFSQENNEFKINDIVQHEKFGQGKIVALDGYGDKAKACIDFAIFGKKWLVLSIAKLTVEQS